MWIHNSDISKKHIHFHIDTYTSVFELMILVLKKAEINMLYFYWKWISPLVFAREFKAIRKDNGRRMLRERKTRCVWWSILRNPKRSFMFLDAEDDALKAFFWTLSLNATRASDGAQNFHSRLKKKKQRRTWKNLSCFVTLTHDVVHHSLSAKLHSSFVKNKRRSFWKLHSWLRMLNYVLSIEYVRPSIHSSVLLSYIRLTR